MRVLMRNTIFKTAVLAGLFSCLLVLAGAFSGITVSVHAITAAEVKTEADLQQFVEDAVDAFYIDFLIRRHCDFSDAPFADLIPPDFHEQSTKEMKTLISLASTVPGLADISVAAYCEEDKILAFDEVFRGDADWNARSIYLFVADDSGKILFHGTDESLEGEVLEVRDAGGRDVAQLIIDEVKTPDNDGLVDYCWDDPTVDEDDIDDNDPSTAPGDSWKRNYVVDPYKYLQLPQPADSPRVIFGSGIYPKTGTPPEKCQIHGEIDTTNGNGGGTPSADSGGGCAIAAGSDDTSRDTAFNLLLIVSALFLAVSLRSRATGQRNGVRS